MNSKLLLLVLVFTSSLVSDTALAQSGMCGSPMNIDCTNMTGMRTCLATVQCTGNYLDSVSQPQAISGFHWDLSVTNSTNVTACLPANSTMRGTTVTFMLTARALTTAPSNRMCSWNWRSTNAGGPRSGPEAGDGRKVRNRLEASGSISLGTANGLPVELMEFSLE